MKKINWKSSGSRKPSKWNDNTCVVSAYVGSFYLSCKLCFTYSLPKRRLGWLAFANVTGSGMPAKISEKPRMRQSLSDSKEDAIRLSKELLLDHQAALHIEMRNFGLEQ